VLGHALLPVVCLADHLVGVGGSLLAGEIVMTGSMVTTTKLPGGPGHYRFNLNGLGGVVADGMRRDYRSTALALAALISAAASSCNRNPSATALAAALVTRST